LTSHICRLTFDISRLTSHVSHLTSDISRLGHGFSSLWGMQTKFNEATDNRPDGARVIDAPFLFIDIEKYHRQLQEEEAWAKNDRNGITVFKSGGQTILLSLLHAGATIANNEVNGTIIFHLLNGSITINIDDKSVALRQNQVITLHAGIKHNLYAADDSLLMITTVMK
jgi:quercetin dioxygenase-like cupin family protein